MDDASDAGEVKVWKLPDGRPHREDGPAVIEPDGTERYYLFGLLHRIGGPAIVSPGASIEFWEHGLCHRVGGPAVIEIDGTIEWWFKGKRDNREGFGSVELVEGVLTYTWWFEGNLHRWEGPSKVCGDHRSYWIFGVEDSLCHGFAV